MSQNSYLRQFYAQMLQIVFLADLTVLQLITTPWAKMWQDHISTSSVHKFYVLIQLYERICHKIHNSTSCVHKYHKSCS